MCPAPHWSLIWGEGSKSCGGGVSQIGVLAALVQQFPQPVKGRFFNKLRKVLRPAPCTPYM